MWMIAGLVIGALLLLLGWDLAGQPTGRRWLRRRRDRAARLAQQRARKA
jgi:hypothetical protein